MPVVTVRLGSERPIETKRRLVSGLTDVVADVLDVPRGEVTILIEEFARENWATGGELNSDRVTSDRENPARQEIEAFFRKPSAISAPKAIPKKAGAKSPRRR